MGAGRLDSGELAVGVYLDPWEERLLIPRVPLESGGTT
jgi:hypothetical protein